MEQSPHCPAPDCDMNDKSLAAKPSTVGGCVLQQLTLITLTNSHPRSFIEAPGDQRLSSVRSGELHVAVVLSFPL